MLSEILKLKDPVVVQHTRAYTQAVGQLAFSAVTRYEVRRGYKRENAIQQIPSFRSFARTPAFCSSLVWDCAADLWALGDAGGDLCTLHARYPCKNMESMHNMEYVSVGSQGT